MLEHIHGTYVYKEAFILCYDSDSFPVEVICNTLQYQGIEF